MGIEAYIGDHAVAQAQSRVWPDQSEEWILQKLIDELKTARFIKPTGREGNAEIWRTGKPHRLRMIMLVGRDGKRMLLTVLNGRA